jgi:hypothetical protein
LKGAYNFLIYLVLLPFVVNRINLKGAYNATPSTLPTEVVVNYSNLKVTYNYNLNLKKEESNSAAMQIRIWAGCTA